MKNNPAAAGLPQVKRTNVVYEFKCTDGDCEFRHSSYIGVTTTTLSRRLTMHLGSGGPKAHLQNHHNSQITRQVLVDNTKILYQINDYHRLHIMEALLIHKNNPSINAQSTGSSRTLKLFSNTNP